MGVITLRFYYLGIVTRPRCRRFVQAYLAAIDDYAGKYACAQMRCL